MIHAKGKLFSLLKGCVKINNSVMFLGHCYIAVSLFLYFFEQVAGNVNCLASSADGSYIFAGLSEGVAVLSMGDHTVKTIWKTEDVEIVALQVKSVGNQLYLLAAVDDMGIT